MKSNRWWEEEARFLCSPQAIEEEEDYLLRCAETKEIPHDQLVSRWQAMLSAKEWLETISQVDCPPEKPTTTMQSGCKSCLSTPTCSCEGYKR
jgi:hypothetical protein